VLELVETVSAGVALSELVTPIFHDVTCPLAPKLTPEIVCKEVPATERVICS
jgi:hypothetical protein